MPDAAWVTGVGMVTPVGIGAEASYDALRAGRSGVGPVRGWDASQEAVQIAAQVPADWEDAYRAAVRLPFARRYGRFTHLGLHAAHEALAQAGLLPDVRDAAGDDHAGVCFGVGGGPTHYLSPLRDALEEGDAERYLSGIDHAFVLRTMFNAPAGLAAIQFRLRGPSGVVAAACASGAGAIAQAHDWLRLGRADWVLCGGTDSTVDRETLRAYHRIGALTVDNARGPSASRPFNVDRSGFVMAEGAGALILETPAHARARGAVPLARLLGTGSVTEAHKITTPLDDGSGMARAMRLALDDAGVAPEAVAHVSAHAPSTAQGDLAEARAVHACFGALAPRVSVTAPKSMLGHAIGASSAIASALAVLGLHRGEQLPTAHLGARDPAIDLDVVTAPRRHDGGAVLVNAFGFGGHDQSLVFAPAD